ncbi:DNA-binding protein [Acinetobacter baumannii]
MSRSGLTKNKVKQARDILISQKKYPSVDAVRIELGNTGSKSTIHKYLKELEEDEEQGIGQNHSISETIQSLVTRLAEQLHIEANIEIEKVIETNQINEEKLKEDVEALRNELSQTKMALQERNERVIEQHEINNALKSSLDKEIITKNRLEQQVISLTESLEQHKEYFSNLEEKFKHAQQSLEHYRESVKEQRQQDIRRHEHQIQLLQAESRQLQQTIITKQDKLNETSLENTKLKTQLSILIENHKTFDKTISDLASELENIKQREASLSLSLHSRNESLQKLENQLKVAIKEKNHLELNNKELEKQLITSQAKFEMQQKMLAQLQELLAKIKR